MLFRSSFMSEVPSVTNFEDPIKDLIKALDAPTLKKKSPWSAETQAQIDKTIQMGKNLQNTAQRMRDKWGI